MGDRTCVTLTFPAELEDLVISISDNKGDDRWKDPDLISLVFYEVNFGNLHFLEALHDKGIPYDSAWEAGSNYQAGTEYCRFTETGEAVLKIVYDDNINPDINRLVQLVHNYAALKNFILNHHEEYSVLPWDDQIKYGKRYQARQLVTS